MYYKWNMPRAFPLEILHFIKKNKIDSPEKNLHIPTKKNRPASVFLLE